MESKKGLIGNKEINNKTKNKCCDCGYILEHFQESCHMCGCDCLESLSEVACSRCGNDREFEDLGDDDCHKWVLICYDCDLIQKVPEVDSEEIIAEIIQRLKKLESVDLGTIEVVADADVSTF